MRSLIMRLKGLLGGNLIPAANVAEGEYRDGVKTFLADAAITESHILGKIGTDTAHIAAAGNDEIPDGIIESEITASEIAQGQGVPVAILGSAVGTRLVRASEAIDPTSVDYVCSAASGRVKALPSGAGTYCIVGKPLTAAAAAGDLIQLAPCVPVQRVVSG